MIELFYAPTPNGWKATIMLAECGLPYTLRIVRLDGGEQFERAFLAISPNNRIPALIDTAPIIGSEPISLFESGAILMYLAEKTGRFLPTEFRRRMEVVKWLMWQVSGLGPMLGQHGHFKFYAPERIPYAIERYANETCRLYNVLDIQLGRTGGHIAGDYSIADIACFPWIMTHKAQGLSLENYPNIKRWYAELRARPEVQSGLAVAKHLRSIKPVPASP